MSIESTAMDAKLTIVCDCAHSQASSISWDDSEAAHRGLLAGPGNGMTRAPRSAFDRCSTGLARILLGCPSDWSLRDLTVFIRIWPVTQCPQLNL